MLFKNRDKPHELIFYELLDQRMSFNQEDHRHFFNVQKGYEGEVLFDNLSNKHIHHFAVLNDLLLEVNNTVFQLDSLMVTGNAVHYFEVKNFDGEHLYEQERLYRISGKEINNPLIQLKRSETLLRQLFQHLHCSLPIKPHVIFINPNFTLFQAPQRTPFILPTQFHSFIRSFANRSPFHNDQLPFINKLLSLHQKENRYTKVPLYQYDLLKKGIKCPTCRHLSIIIKGRNLVCQNCSQQQALETGIVRCVQELKFLFPEKKITTNLVEEWCNLNIEKRRIQRILERNFSKKGVRQWSYYE